MGTGKRVLLWLVGLLAPLVLATAGQAHQTHPVAAPAAATPSPARPVDDGTPLPALVARFRVSLTPRGGRTQVQQWQLNRSATEIGWIKAQGLEEVWRRDASGIRLERVLRRDQHVVDYSAGELRTLGVLPDWRELGSLFAETDLALLQRQGRAGAGQPLHYRGRIGGESVDLRWDPAARLPLRLQRSGRNGQVVYQRVALHATAPAQWPRAGAHTTTYQRLDAADFGDMAHHPVVRQAQARDERAGWRRPHAD